MFKKFNVFLLGALVLGGTFFTACQKDQSVSPTQVESSNSREVYVEAEPVEINQDLLNSMAANDNVRALILESYSFSNDFEKAVEEMDPEARAEYLNSQRAGVSNYLVRTPEQMAEYHARLSERKTQMFQDFPLYREMDATKRAVFDGKLDEIVLEGLQLRTCGGGYRYCIRKECGGWGGGDCGTDCFVDMLNCLNIRYGI